MCSASTTKKQTLSGKKLLEKLLRLEIKNCWRKDSESTKGHERSETTRASLKLRNYEEPSTERSLMSFLVWRDFIFFLITHDKLLLCTVIMAGTAVPQGIGPT